MADVKLVGNDDLAWNLTFIKDYFVLYKFQAVKTGTLTSIRVKNSASGDQNIKVAIYSNVADEPSALLASVGSTAIVAGWNTISISDVSIVANEYYWIAWNESVGKTLAYNGSTRIRRYKSATFSTFSFPNPAGTGFTANSGNDPAFAGWGEEAASGSIVPLLSSRRRFQPLLVR